MSKLPAYNAIHDLPHLRLPPRGASTASLPAGVPRALLPLEQERAARYNEQFWEDKALPVSVRATVDDTRYISVVNGLNWRHRHADDEALLRDLDDERLRPIVRRLPQCSNWELVSIMRFITSESSAYATLNQMMLPFQHFRFDWLHDNYDFVSLLQRGNKIDESMREFSDHGALVGTWPPQSMWKLFEGKAFREEVSDICGATIGNDEDADATEQLGLRDHVMHFFAARCDHEELRPFIHDATGDVSPLLESCKRLLNSYPAKPMQYNVLGPRQNPTCRAFQIHNVLSPDECSFLRSIAEPLLQPVDAHFEQRYRVSDRAMIRSPHIADEIFRRVVPHLKPEDYKNRIPLCFRQDGLWLPFACNECLKVVRYSPGGHFSPHRDAPWVPSEDQCSIYTIIVYLNEDFRGGLTELITSADPDVHYFRNSASPGLVIPTMGTALVFNHDMWHSAHPVIVGAKWILRTELVFQRKATHFVDKYLHVNDEAFLACRALYGESTEHLRNGDRAAFAEKYQRVIAIQQAAMLDVVRERAQYQRVLGVGTSTAVSSDVFAHILSFLDDPQLVQMLQVSKGNFYAVMNSDVWEWKVLAKYPAAVDTATRLLLGCHNAIDWHRVYAQQRSLSRGFTAAALVLTEDSSIIVVTHKDAPLQRVYGGRSLGHNTNNADTNCNVQFCNSLTALVDPSGTYTAFRVGGFAVLLTGDPYHMNLPHWQRYAISVYENFREFNETDDHDGDDENVDLEENEDSRVERLVKRDGAVSWSIIAPELAGVFAPIWIPVVVVGHPAWFAEGNDDAVAKNERDIFLLMRSPAIKIVHPAQCLLVSAGVQPASTAAPAVALVFVRFNRFDVAAAIVNLSTFEALATVVQQNCIDDFNAEVELAARIRNAIGSERIDRVDIADLYVRDEEWRSIDGLSAKPPAPFRSWTGPKATLADLGVGDLVTSDGCEKPRIAALAHVTRGAKLISESSWLRDACTFRP